MTINQAIKQLLLLRDKHGDVKVQADCPYCGKGFDCDVAVIAPEVVKLNQVSR